MLCEAGANQKQGVSVCNLPIGFRNADIKLEFHTTKLR